MTTPRHFIDLWKLDGATLRLLLEDAKVRKAARKGWGQGKVDADAPADGRVLFTVEHEVRSLTHPLYGRPLVNRNPYQTNREFANGYETRAWEMPWSESADW